MPLDIFTDPDSVQILGPVSISKNPQSGLDGNLTVNGAGGLSINVLSGGVSATAATIASNGTIALNRVTRVTTGGAVTGVIITPGTLSGQDLIVINESANTLTMAAAGTSNVASGVTTIIKASGAARFVWDASTALWYSLY